MKNSKNSKTKTADERREAAQAKAPAALDRLGDGIRAVWQSDAWTRWLDTMARFHDYSLNNTLLIAMQMPGATQVASYRSCSGTSTATSSAASRSSCPCS